MTATTAQLSFAVSDSVASQALSCRPRRISPQAGRALEKLGHVIEYLAHEDLHVASSPVSSRAQMEAIHLLMEINWRIYMESTEILPFSERCRVLLHQLFA